MHPDELNDHPSAEPPPAEPSAEREPPGERSLDPAWIAVTRIASAVTAAILSSALFFVIIGLILALRPGLVIGAALLGGWFVLSLLLALWALQMPAIRYRHYSYRVAETGLQIRRGVLWREIVTVPRRRLQHTDVSQGPVERAFGLATLVLHTAGTIHASVSLPGLPHATALEIRDFLIEDTEDDAF